MRPDTTICQSPLPFRARDCTQRLSNSSLLFGELGNSLPVNLIASQRNVSATLQKGNASWKQEPGSKTKPRAIKFS